MAATKRAASPTTEPFPPLEQTPRTPTSASATATTHAHFAAGVRETPNLLRAHTPAKPGSLSPRSQKPTFSAAVPLPLTGAAAMAEIRKQQKEQQQRDGRSDRATSPNPQMQAMHTLMGAGGMSKPSDAPAPNKLSEPLQKVAQKINAHDHAHNDGFTTSPASISSYGTLESTSAAGMTATASNATAPSQQYVDEPMEMSPQPPSNGHLAVASEQDGPKAFSYPGPPPQDQGSESGPSRGMSLPGYGQGSPKSPASNKRHKCPYCDTDFTRHHNLKSHLLTHSQEKPYVCQTCQARFRRLHDLKRHMKLHTGERPHTCDKCGRRFARGDALARHNKGPGGCAGRRSSIGGDDEFPDGDGQAMDGVEYDEESSPDGRRTSEPSRKRAHLETVHDPAREVYRQHSSTYPPAPTRTPTGSMGGSNMGPPQVVLAGSNQTASPRDMSGHPSPTAGSAYFQAPGQVFAQQSGGMTESPKPLSPGQPGQDPHRLSVGDASMAGTRNRSPSLTTQFQQAHFGRGSGRGTPSHPPPQYATHHGSQPPPPLLPPLSGAAPTRSMVQPSSIPGPGPSSLQHHSLPPTSGAIGSNPGSLSSHGRSSGSSIRDTMQDPNDIWSYVRSVEQRMSRMQDEYELRIGRLSEELIQLRSQVGTGNSYSSDLGQPRY